jgi:sarcosine oxidase subunit alpha
VIAPLIDGVDLSGEAFPHMAVRLCRILGAPCRLFRVSFTGEIGYEINVPADFGQNVWEAVYERGQAFGITPYGTQAMHVLRAERGFIIVGQETDGTMTPDDVGLAGMIAKAKPDFVGKRSLARPDLIGAQIVADPAAPMPIPMLGHVTSSYWSANCDRSIALAVVADGRNLLGRKLHATTPAGFAPVTVSAPVFFDPKGERAHG